MRFRRVLRGVAAVLAVVVASPALGQTVLYSQDFDIDDSANWNVNRTTLSSAFDSPVDLFFDYNTVGIPSAPHSTGGTTRGVKLQANLQGAGTLADPDALIGVSVSPTGQSFTGDYVVKADVWSNFLGPLATGASGTTMITNLGILTSGTTHNIPGQSAAQGGIDGAYFGATGDAGSSADFRAYSIERNVSYQLPHLAPNEAIDAHATYAAGTRNVAAGNLYATTFPSVSAPAGQTASYPATQTGSTTAGGIGFAWHEFEIKKQGNAIEWRVNGTLLISVDATAFIGTVGGGNISLSYADINFTTNTADPTFFDLQFGLFDNIRVETLAAPLDNADFDGDGDKDGNDFLIWQQNVGTGTTQPEGDANNSTTVDGADLVIWETQFGTSTAAAQSVPEPATWLMAALSSLAMLFTRRRQLAPNVARR